MVFVHRQLASRPVEAIINGEVHTREELVELSPKVMEWVMHALTVAHEDEHAKSTLQRLLGHEYFTSNLGYLGQWSSLKTFCEIQALAIGEQMQTYFIDCDLGQVLGAALPHAYGRLQPTAVAGGGGGGGGGADGRTDKGTNDATMTPGRMTPHSTRSSMTKLGDLFNSMNRFDALRSKPKSKKVSVVRVQPSREFQGAGGTRRVVCCEERDCTRRQSEAMPFPFVRIEGKSQLYSEKVYAHVLRMIAMGLDSEFQTAVNIECDECGGDFEAAMIKGYTRMVNKCLSKSDHYYEDFPRPACNIDINRNVSTFRNPESLLSFVQRLKRNVAFGSNPVRMKNMFLFDDERAAQQFYYRTVMINWLYTPGLTYSELGKMASKLWDRYQDFHHVPGVGSKDPSESPRVWQQQIMEAREFLTSAPMRNMKVQFIVETQLLLDPYYKGRQQMHLLYKIARAENPAALSCDFCVDSTDEHRSFDMIENEALVEVKSFLSEMEEELSESHKEHHVSASFSRVLTTTMMPKEAFSGKLDHNDETFAKKLWTCAEGGHDKAVREMMKLSRVDVNAAPKDTQTSSLYIAAYHGHERVVKALLDHPEIRVNHGGVDTGVSPLFVAVQQGREGVVQMLLTAKGVDVNKPTSDGTTALISGCELGHDHVVGYLVESKHINVFHEIRNGSTALSIAASRGHMNIVNILENHVRSKSCVPMDDFPDKASFGSDDLYRSAIVAWSTMRSQTKVLSSVRIQSKVRAKIQRRVFIRKKQAAVRIQSRVRIKLAHKHCQVMAEAARKHQRGSIRLPVAPEVKLSEVLPPEPPEDVERCLWNADETMTPESKAKSDTKTVGPPSRVYYIPF
jgi:ankyrin repeat protein